MNEIDISLFREQLNRICTENEQDIERRLFDFFLTLSPEIKDALLNDLHTAYLDIATHNGFPWLIRNYLPLSTKHPLSIENYFHCITSLLENELITADFVIKLFSYTDEMHPKTMPYYLFRHETTKHYQKELVQFGPLFLGLLEELSKTQHCATDIVKLASPILLPMGINQELDTRIEYLAFLKELLRDNPDENIELTNALVALFNDRNEDGINFGITCINEDYTSENHYEKITTLCTSYLDLLNQLTNNDTANIIFETLACSTKSDPPFLLLS